MDGSRPEPDKRTAMDHLAEEQMAELERRIDEGLTENARADDAAFRFLGRLAWLAVPAAIAFLARLLHK